MNYLFLFVVFIIVVHSADVESDTSILCSDCSYSNFNPQNSDSNLDDPTLSRREGQYVGSVMKVPLSLNRDASPTRSNTIHLGNSYQLQSGVYDVSSRSNNPIATKYKVYSKQNKKPYFKDKFQSGSFGNGEILVQNSFATSENSKLPVQNSFIVQESGGNAQQNTFPAPENNLQQVQTDLENSVGEVIQPEQDRRPDQSQLSPEFFQGGSNDLYSPPQPNYGYGYPYSGYQQPLPFITTPSPIDAVGEPPPLPTNAPLGPLPGPPSLPIPKPPIIAVPPIPYGYYFLGVKFWVVPLYFCVYYIVYVAWLMIKAIKRHKARYPENLHNAVVNARSFNGFEQFLIELVMTLLETFY